MKKSYKHIYSLLVALLLLPCIAFAQTSSINAYSPYSMYGPGELSTPGTVQMRSMGGVGIARRTVGQVNTLNPAASSVAPRKTFLFDVGIDGTHFRNNQPKYNAEGVQTSTAKTVYNTANIHSIALTFPLAKGLGTSISVSPYSSVGYKVRTTDEDPNNWANIGRVQYGYEGTGDITEVKVSVGWAPWQKFSIGVAAKYYWGYIERKYQAEATDVVTGSGNYSPTVGTDKYVVSNFKMQVGMQWSIIQNELRILTLGATYDLGGNLNPRKESYVSTSTDIANLNKFPIRNQTNALELRVPHQVGVGVYFRDRAWAVGADYVYAAWGKNNASFDENSNPVNVVVKYADTHTFKAGFEITPRSSDVRNYLNRMTYRAGVRFGNYYQTFGGQSINQLAITAGLGLPVKIWGASSMNIGFEYGRMSVPGGITMEARKVGLVTQNYYKISLGFSLFSSDTSDYWFVRQKFD